MDRLRTFGIVAHIDAGKTTLTERILHDAGEQSHVGSVDDGTSAMDWMPAERSRGISITAAATRVNWSGCTLQVVDTPGHVDFVAEVERCLHVLDGVVVIVDGVRGVQSQTETVWRQAENRRLPRIAFVNKLDRVGASFEQAMTHLREKFDCRPAAVVVPLRDGDGEFAGLGHAVTGAVQWFEGAPDPAIVPGLKAQLVAANDKLVEIAADLDGAVMDDVVAGRTVPPDRLVAVLRRGAIRRAFTPVLAGAALWNRGVDWLLDAIVDLLPSHGDVERTGIWGAERAGDPTAPACGLVFKVQHDEAIWNFVRLVRGQLTAGDTLTNVRTGTAIAVDELWMMHGDRHRVLPAVAPGEIVVVPGDFDLMTGDSLCATGHPLALPVPEFPPPVLAVTFEPDHSENGPRLFEALRDLAGDDPTLEAELSHGEVNVRGMGELHLEIVAEVVRGRVDFAFDVGKPRVERRETVASAAVGEVEIRATVAEALRAVRCEVRVAPLPAAPLSAEPSSVAGGERSAAEGAAVVRSSVTADAGERGKELAIVERFALAELRSRALSGLRAGSLVDADVELCALTIDPPAGAAAEFLEGLIEQAATRALTLAVERAGLVELEPVVQLEVTCPEDGCAAVLADLGSRGADVSSVVSGSLGARIVGRAPLSRMLGYVTRLRSITKGRGQAWLRPAGFQAS